MSWQDRQANAKFRGVAMLVSSTTVTKGRRVPVRELAGQDNSVQQDLGRSPDTIEVSVFYGGAAYDQQRDALEDALTKEGAAELQLPFRPLCQARVISGPFTNESKEELGWCTIRFTVVVEPAGGGNASSTTGLKAVSSTGAALKTSAQKTQKIAAVDMANKVKPGGMPSSALASTVKAIKTATDALRTVQRNIGAAISLVSAPLNAADDFTAQLAELDSNVNTLMSTPSALATKLTAATLGVVGLGDTVERNLDRTTGLILEGSLTPFERASPARATLGAVKTLSALGSSATTSTGISVGKGSLPPATDTRVDAGTTGALVTPTQTIGGVTIPQRSTLSVSDQEQVNTRTIYQDVRILAVARAAETYATATFDSSTNALSTLQTMSDSLDDLQDYCGSDSLVDSLSELRGALAAHMTAVASQLPAASTYSPVSVLSMSDQTRGAVVSIGQTADALDSLTSRRGTGTRLGLPFVATYSPPREVPALLIAYEFYGDAELADDIVARNNTPYPLFISEPIEIIEAQ